MTKANQVFNPSSDSSGDRLIADSEKLAIKITKTIVTTKTSTSQRETVIISYEIPLADVNSSQSDLPLTHNAPNCSSATESRSRRLVSQWRKLRKWVIGISLSATVPWAIRKILDYISSSF